MDETGYESVTPLQVLTLGGDPGPTEVGSKVETSTSRGGGPAPPASRRRVEGRDDYPFLSRRPWVPNREWSTQLKRRWDVRSILVCRLRRRVLRERDPCGTIIGLSETSYPAPVGPQVSNLFRPLNRSAEPETQSVRNLRSRTSLSSP